MVVGGPSGLVKEFETGCIGHENDIDRPKTRHMGQFIHEYLGGGRGPTPSTQLGVVGIQQHEVLVKAAVGSHWPIDRWWEALLAQQLSHSVSEDEDTPPACVSTSETPGSDKVRK